MTINHASGHRDRLRARVIEHGLESLADYEVMEVVLMGAIPRKDVKPIAKTLIRTFGSLNNVMNASLSDLKKIDGIGETSAFAIQLYASVNYYLKRDALKKKRTSLQNQLDMLDYLYTRFDPLTHEEFHVIYLDSKNNIIQAEMVFRGSVNSSAVYPREVMKEAVKKGAASIVVAHNHPSGDPTPSLDDEIVTVELANAARTLSIRLLDHVIIGKGQHFSFADEGKLS